jgi:hypothetical protein
MKRKCSGCGADTDEGFWAKMSMRHKARWLCMKCLMAMCRAEHKKPNGRKVVFIAPDNN